MVDIYECWLVASTSRRLSASGYFLRLRPHAGPHARAPRKPHHDTDSLCILLIRHFRTHNWRTRLYNGAVAFIPIFIKLPEIDIINYCCYEISTFCSSSVGARQILARSFEFKKYFFMLLINSQNFLYKIISKTFLNTYNKLCTNENIREDSVSFSKIKMP